MTHTILLIIGAIIVLLLLIATFDSKEMNIEQTIIIHKPKQQVFDYLRYLKNHENFNVWTMMDPDMKKEYKGTDGQIGFQFAWDSNKKKNVGAGEQEIKKINNGVSIEHEIRFIRPMQDVAKTVFTTESVSDDQTRVQWDFYSKMKFPFNLMKPIIKNMLSKNVAAGLRNLKTVLEK